MAQRAANKAYRAWKAAGKPRNDDHPLRTAYKTFKTKFRAKLRAHRKDLRESFFAKLDHNDSDSRKLFREIRNFNGQTANPSTSIHLNSTTYEDDTLLEGWASYFEDLNIPSHHNTYDTPFQQAVHQQFLRLLESPLGEDLSFTTAEVAEAIKALKPQKAPGPDGIETEHLLFSGPNTIRQLTDTFNAILSTGHIPQSFLHGHITPIPKSHNKDQSDPSNYTEASPSCPTSPSSSRSLSSAISSSVTYLSTRFKVASAPGIAPSIPASSSKRPSSQSGIMVKRPMWPF